MGVSGEERRLSDVVKVAVELHNALKTEAGTTVSGRAVLEGVDVVLDGVDGEAALDSALLEHLGVVDSLSAGSDLLASHKEVVRVGEAGVLGVQHGVEGSGRHGVAVEHVEVGVVLLTHDGAELLLGLSGEILEFGLLETSLVNELDTFSEVKLHDGLSALELLEGVLLVDDSELSSVSGLQVLAQVCDHLANQVQYLEVMVLEFHFHIETSEFAQVTVGVGVLSTEDGSDLEHAGETTAKGHLLVELRGLSEATVLLEVLELEHVGTTFGGATDQLGGVDFDEVPGNHEFTVDSANTGLQTENSLIGGNSKIDDSIIEAHVLLDHGELLDLLLGFLVVFFAFGFAVLSSLVEHLAGGVLNLEGQNGHGLVDTPKLFDLELNLLGAAVNVVVGLGNQGYHLDDGLLGQLGSVLDHALANVLLAGLLVLVHEEDSLHGAVRFTHHDKSHVTLGAGAGDTAADSD